jgi:hypothetical protein
MTATTDPPQAVGHDDSAVATTAKMVRHHCRTVGYPKAASPRWGKPAGIQAGYS